MEILTDDYCPFGRQKRLVAHIEGTPQVVFRAADRMLVVAKAWVPAYGDHKPVFGEIRWTKNYRPARTKESFIRGTYWRLFITPDMTCYLGTMLLNWAMMIYDPAARDNLPSLWDTDD